MIETVSILGLIAGVWFVWKAIKVEFFEDYGVKPTSSNTVNSTDQWDDIGDIIDDLD